MDDWIDVKLDGALVTIGFMTMFKDATLTNLEVLTSDHCLLFLELYKAHYAVKMRSFCFKNAWLGKSMCKKLVEDVWFRNHRRSFYDKIAECTEVLSAWV